MTGGGSGSLKYSLVYGRSFELIRQNIPESARDSIVGTGDESKDRVSGNRAAHRTTFVKQRNDRCIA
jgi:hypothetical protein